MTYATASCGAGSPTDRATTSADAIVTTARTVRGQSRRTAAGSTDSKTRIKITGRGAVVAASS